MNAVDYAHLVGRYVSMSRPKTRDDHPSDPATIGGEGFVVVVTDNPEGVSICFDYGMGFVVPREGSTWSFAIWPDEATRKEWRSIP